MVVVHARDQAGRASTLPDLDVARAKAAVDFNLSTAQESSDDLKGRSSLLMQ